MIEQSVGDTRGKKAKGRMEGKGGGNDKIIFLFFFKMSLISTKEILEANNF